MEKAKILKLDNGINVVLLNYKNSKSVSLGVWISVGARDEIKGEMGIAHFLEHMAFKGTKKRNAKQIVSDIENVGGHMNAYTSREETAYYIRVLPEHIDLSIEILSDIIKNSTLPKDEIERERGVIIQEIGQSIDAPDDKVFDLFNDACYPNHTLGKPILGDVNTVSKFSRNQLIDFMKRHYTANQIIISVSGNFKEDELIKKLNKKFIKIPQQKSIKRKKPIWNGMKTFVDRDLEQCHIVFGFSGISALSNHRFPLMLLSNIYGGGMSSRLFQEVREKKGLCYSIFSFSQSLSDSGMFGVYAGTSNESANEMIKLSAYELIKCTESISKEELNRAKQQVKASILMGQDSSNAMMNYNARQMLLYGKLFKSSEIIKKIESLSSNDIKNVANIIITNSKPTIAVVGPCKNILEYQEFSDLFL